MRRKCRFPNCNAYLSSYNKSKFCWHHQVLLEQNDVKYKKRKFYLGSLEIPLEKVESLKFIVETLRKI